MTPRIELLIDCFLRFENQAQMLWQAGAIVCIAALCCCTLALPVVAAPATLGRPGRVRNLLTSEIVFCSLIGFTVLFLRIPCLILYQCNVDEAEWISGAITLWEDPRFWGSVDAHTSGPLVVFPLLSAKLFGNAIDYLSARCLSNVLWAAIACITYQTFRLISPTAIARLLVLPLVATVALFSNCDYVGYNGEHMPVFLLSTAFFLATKLMMSEMNRNLHSAQLLLLGVTLGCIPFAKLQAAPMGMAIGLVALVATPAWRGRAVLVAGAAAPTALVYCYLAAFGLLEDFWYSYILSNLNYATNASPATPWKRIVRLPFFLFDLEESRYFFLTQMSVLVGFLAIILSAARSVDRDGRRMLLLSGAYLFGSFYGVLQSGMFHGHYFLLLLHPLIMATGTGITVLASMKSPMAEPRLRPVWGALFLITMVLGPASRVITNGNAGLVGLNVRKEIMHASPVASLIQQIRTEESSLAVWGWAPHYFVQTRLKQAVPDAHTLYEITEGPYQAYYTNRFVNDIAAKKSVIFVDATKSIDSKYFNDERYRHENYPAVAELVRTRFRFVAEYDGSRIYVSK